MVDHEYILELVCGRKCPTWVQPYDPDEWWILSRKYNTRASVRKGPKPETDYAEYLADAHWQRFRVAVLVLGGGMCVHCGGEAECVHHLNYDRVGCEQLTDVEPVCHACHKVLHSIEDGKKVEKPAEIDLDDLIKDLGL